MHVRMLSMNAAQRILTDPETSDRMRRIRRSGTGAELAVRGWLWKQGIRFATKNRDLPGSPDIANRSKRWAVFVHGCFWHGHAGCKRAALPKRNAEFWVGKIEGNRRRDRQKEKMLRALGFKVVVVWECETKTRDLVSLKRRFRSIRLLRAPPGAQ